MLWPQNPLVILPDSEPEPDIVDLEGDAVEIHRDPSSTGFQRSAGVLRGATVAPIAFPDVTLAVADILG